MNRHPQSRTNESPNVRNQKTFYANSRHIVADLFQRKASVYWIDFTLSVLAAYSLISLFLASPLTSIVGWVSFFVGGVLIYRSSMFVHELVHLPQNDMVWFRRYWNSIAGVPLMVPTFAYTSHNHHHSSRHYGTDHDGEYLPLARGTVWGVIAFLAQIFFQPLMVFARYLLLTPISFLHPSLRRWTLIYASSLVINFHYEKDLKPGKWSREDTFWEILTWLRTVLMIGLVVAGIMPAVRLPKFLWLAMFVLTLNHLRTLTAHRYTNEGSTISHLDQFLDSTNITGSWLTELICPLGLRYHALHHLFPGIPYHNLGIAHRRLTTQLPPDSIYREAEYPNMWAVLKDLHHNISGNNHRERC